MKNTRPFFSISVFVVGILLSCSQATMDREAEIAAIRGFSEDYARYAKNKDLDSLMYLFTDDAKRSQPGTPTIVGKENLRAVFREIINQGDHTLTPYGEFDIDVSGDLGYIYYTMTISTRPKDLDTLVHVDVKGVTILKKQADGTWKATIDCLNFHPTFNADSIESELLKETSPYY